MAPDTEATDASEAPRPSRFRAALPDSMGGVDRILLGACAVIWLAALGTGVAATVALVDLGRGHRINAEPSGTPWVLYTVIGVSALVIAGAVPLLLRARRAAVADPDAPPSPPDSLAADAPPSRPRGAEAPTEKLRMFGSLPDKTEETPEPALRSAPTDADRGRGPTPTLAEQLMLRCSVVLGCAVGLAVVAIAVATYSMAVDNDARLLDPLRRRRRPHRRRCR